MPTYEYKCPRCGTEFEQVQKITAKPGARCPACGGRATRQLSGGAGLVFKGSGFYLTDYGRAGQKKAAEPTAEGSTASESKGGEAKSAKPATPAKPKKAD